MKHLTTQMQSRLAILVFPYEPQLEEYDRGRETEYVLKPQRRINALCEKYDVPCLDVFPAFYKRNSVKLFRDGIHLTREGHQLTASLIDTFLHENNLISSSP
jgi:lysophospholipase L1-like esterase